MKDKSSVFYLLKSGTEDNENKIHLFFRIYVSLILLGLRWCPLMLEGLTLGIWEPLTRVDALPNLGLWTGFEPKHLRSPRPLSVHCPTVPLNPNEDEIVIRSSYCLTLLNLEENKIIQENIMSF